MKLLITCFEGTAPILSNELKIMGFKTFNNFSTGMYVECENIKDIWRLNLNSRIANKIFLEVCSSHIDNFDSLFDFVNGINWQNYITKGHKIEISANIYNSKINSTKSTQSIVNKSILKKLLGGENKQRFSNPDFEPINILVQIIEDKCSIFVNTSGISLHNRGYRIETGEAPLKENLAASIVRLCNRHYKTPLLDPMCGSGTICIEAAMIAKNIAPGLKRHFAFESFADFDTNEFNKMKNELKSKIFKGDYKILGYDINPKMVEIAQKNAKSAGVDDIVRFETHDIFDKTKFEGFIVTNPPYGKRLRNYNLDGLYQNLINLYKGNLGCFISSRESVDKVVGYDFKIKNLNNNGEMVKVYLKK